MKVQVSKKALAERFAHVERIVPARSSNPGLNLVRIDLGDDQLRFVGSNLDLDVRTALPADVSGEGAVAVPAHVFGQVVRALPGEDVALEVEDRELAITSGSFGTRLQLADLDSAPNPAFADAHAAELPGSALAAALGQVRYAAAVAEYQAIFRGVKLELSDEGTRAVATDGFRLAYFDLDAVSGLDAEIVVPARSVDEIVRLLEDEPVKLQVGEGSLSLASGAFEVNAKLMEGSFPDYRRVIPANFPVVVTLPAQALAESVTRVAVMADKTANNRVDLFIRDGTMQITAEGSYGRSQEAMEVSQEGSDAEIALAYNARYLTDALGPLTGDLRLSLSGPTSPSLLTEPSDPHYLAMVVPLRTG